jgi:hypothetical protein
MMGTATLTCDACGGDLGLLGVLGNLAHFRCRDCGLDCSTTVIHYEPPEGWDDDIEDDDDTPEPEDD